MIRVAYVTQEHIDDSEKINHDSCMVSKAIMDLGFRKVYVGASDIEIDEEYKVPCSRTIYERVFWWYSDHKISPFHFSVTVDDDGKIIMFGEAVDDYEETLDDFIDRINTEIKDEGKLQEPHDNRR